MKGLMSFSSSLETTDTAAPARQLRRRSIAVLVAIWLVLHLGCLFTPGLLDDVDSVYIEVAREMLQRHDYVTPVIDGIRFFDKPPLMYWMAAAGMKVFGPFDWAARLPLSLAVLGLFLSVYALGRKLFGERGGFYAALAMATSLGPYLFTRFYIPDILNALWMTLGVHLFLIALDRARTGHTAAARWATWAFAAVMALNLLTKGLIGIVFPIGFVVLYALLTRQMRRTFSLPILSALAIFAAIALPWHVLAALRNPAIAMPAGTGLPAHAGWFWFYIINEHFMRFRGLRIPHDYGQVPIPLFWLMFFLWLMPWVAFLPAAWTQYARLWRDRALDSSKRKQAALTVLLWSGMVLGFFTLSSRQEYYSLPALPALALMAGGVVAGAEHGDPHLRRNILRASTWFLLPLCTLIGIVCGVLGIISPSAPEGADISQLLTSNPDQYNLALGHLHDLTTRAMGFFRAPLLGMAVSMLGVGPIAWWLRWHGDRRIANRDRAANSVLAVSMCGVLLCVHTGLARFYPIIGSKGLATQLAAVVQPQDAVMLDGELTSGSTLLFYTRHPLQLVNGRVNGPWFGSFWPDAPHIFEDEASLHRAWAGSQRVYLLTYEKPRIADLQKFAPVRIFAESGGKMILTNKP
ncbi:PMT family glycosyltransferase, 4-amino-4-deoxy-L-arabinose transferase [Terriglobus roseus DSM 18391]|uniref:PMT family glycosyltransferase, 4-amino-4-deoxy-L-arabinose transferase n=1 Tax=Terriglobus roseus (strain DSM 18391 / NRRL B-41598 / KBS 63) TaxID=926566 RepID=I3ZKL1_TERRK|nr:PMT family glycosyltransferase, 4-amino-4-deoxy-L-arabinose transferase [Terriglobus roseus DSM 18391]